MLSIQLTTPALEQSVLSVFSPTRASPVYPLFSPADLDAVDTLPDIAFALLSPQHSLLSSQGHAAASALKRVKPLKIVVNQRKSSISSQSSSISKAPAAIHVHPNALPSFQMSSTALQHSRSVRSGTIDHDATPTQTPRTAKPLRRRQDV